MGVFWKWLKVSWRSSVTVKVAGGYVKVFSNVLEVGRNLTMVCIEIVRISCSGWKSDEGPRWLLKADRCFKTVSLCFLRLAGGWHRCGWKKCLFWGFSFFFNKFVMCIIETEYTEVSSRFVMIPFIFARCLAEGFGVYSRFSGGLLKDFRLLEARWEIPVGWVSIRVMMPWGKASLPRSRPTTTTNVCDASWYLHNRHTHTDATNCKC